MGRLLLSMIIGAVLMATADTWMSFDYSLSNLLGATREAGRIVVLRKD